MAGEAEVPLSRHWGEVDGRRLKLARHAAGHSQEKCALAICEAGGQVSQQQISEWEHGNDAPSDANLGPALRYVEEFGIGLAAVPEASSLSNVVSIEQDEAPGVEQQSGSELRTAIARRIGSGPPMSEWDFKAIAAALGIV